MCLLHYYNYITLLYSIFPKLKWSYGLRTKGFSHLKIGLLYLPPLVVFVTGSGFLNDASTESFSNGNY